MDFRFNARRDLGDREWETPYEHVATSRPSKVRAARARMSPRQGWLARLFRALADLGARRPVR